MEVQALYPGNRVCHSLQGYINPYGGLSYLTQGWMLLHQGCDSDVGQKSLRSVVSGSRGMEVVNYFYSIGLTGRL